METRANYILIGVFTLVGMIGILAFFLWFARVELDRQFAYYDVAFTSVSGLSAASDVRFAGLPVGQVVDVRLSPDRDGTILARLEVDAETPVRADSLATIESQGVTGVSYVGISPGTTDAPLLDGTDTSDIPMIEAGRSAIQSLTEDGPELISEALRVMSEIGDLVGGENQARMENILINVEAASADFSSTLQGFSEVTASVSGFADQIDRFNSTLETLTSDLSVVLASADTTFLSLTDLSEQAQEFLQDGSETLDAAEQTITDANVFVAEDLPALTEEFRLTVEDLRTQVAALSTDARRTLEIFNDTGMTATARLVEAEEVLVETRAMIVDLEITLASVDEAANSFDDLVDNHGAALVAETRAMVDAAATAIDAISKTAQDDLPAIVASIRDTSDTVARVVTQVGDDLTSASGRIDGLAASAETTMTTVTNTFQNANTTLTAINEALDVGQGALNAAERAFNGADKVLNEDVAAITADLRGAIDRLNGVVAQVSEDIPGVTADLRAASTSAQSLFLELEGLVSSSGTAIDDFATSGLPLYTRLAQETRTLISNLDRLTTQIQRDPARFFLNQQTPEFRR